MQQVVKLERPRSTTDARTTIDDLVQDDRVRAKVYTDEAIFDLEMERVFGRAWIFMAHESQIPRAGDFVTSAIGRQPVIVVRAADGSINVLYNRCPHRGAIVCRESEGNTHRFACPYHGWNFRIDGELSGIPFRNAYDDAFLEGENLSLARVARVENYRGFVFASAAESGPSLVDYIGPLKDGIDNLLDRSPTGEVFVSAGVHRYRYKGNWKMQLENGLDEYHPPFSHASTVRPGGQQLQRAYAAKTGYKVLSDKDPNQADAKSHYDHGEVHGARYGQAFLTIPDATRRSELEVPEYRQALIDRHGEQKALDIIANSNMSNAVFYPSLIVRVSGNMHIRVVRPIAVDETEVLVWPMQVKGVPDQVNKGIVRYANVHVSVSSFVQTDDLEIFERVFEGLQAGKPDWVMLARGYGREWEGPYPDEKVGYATWETGMRAQFRYWKALMSEAM
ncbi:Rieske (2Fe-2S) domain-containing protein [Paraburkholderia piptadeniae]|uniref:Rieske (2Fe-2S) domain-containing protein n=1 Tax=Paraburkholderia piptadeniae TaxID=1701573 RepID=A0A1N7S173_9BURK|nr:aromatic ring-hydroxylating dioxygenase subunit alpha [Paraburkholderia piptadeniae]SIT40727.1 Rieske (2Fe-2S) domain-containing protein [Paraburkholderia piptadeniae]